MDKLLEKYSKYPVKDNYIVNDRNYQRIETGAVRRRTFYAYLPVYIGIQDFIPLCGCKFAWFTTAEVVEKKILTRWTEFDDGWNYQNYWVKWKPSWFVIDVIKINKNEIKKKIS
jgi:hypothetical protein